VRRVSPYDILDSEYKMQLVRFASTEEAMKYHNPPEYPEAAAVRKACAGRRELVLTEAIDLGAAERRA
jgi:uncharacterized protein (DUF1330 family)